MREILREQRIKGNYTQETIAKELGISRPTYTNIENGRKNPSFTIALRIKNLLNYSDDDIFLDEQFLKETKSITQEAIS